MLSTLFATVGAFACGVLLMLGPTSTGSVRFVRLNIRLNQTSSLHAESVVLTSADGRGHPAVLQGDEFYVPEDLLSCPKLAVTIALPDESLDLVAVDQDDFRGTWDIFLSDKAFPSRFALPRGAKAKEVCVVTFEWGEGDPRQIAQSKCRQRLPRSRSARTAQN